MYSVHYHSETIVLFIANFAHTDVFTFAFFVLVFVFVFVPFDWVPIMAWIIASITNDKLVLVENCSFLFNRVILFCTGTAAEPIHRDMFWAFQKVRITFETIQGGEIIQTVINDMDNTHIFHSSKNWASIGGINSIFVIHKKK